MMGLDITAYKQIQHVMAWPADAESPDDFLTYAPVHRSYVLNSTPVTYICPGGLIDFPHHCTTLTPGVYSYGAQMTFRAGPYSGYNEWRDMLCHARFGVSANDYWKQGACDGVGWLINFSDCEGYIDARIARIILDDLTAHYTRIAMYGGKWWQEQLSTWSNALAFAADNGILDFH